MISLGHEYTHLTYLGEGAFGHVYKAHDDQGRTVVVKILWRKRHTDLENILARSPDASALENPSPDAVAQAKREYEILGSLHKQFGSTPIRAPFECGLWPNEVTPKALAMEFIDSNIFVPVTQLLPQEDDATQVSNQSLAPLIPANEVRAVTTVFLEMLRGLHQQGVYLEDAQLKNLCRHRGGTGEWRILDWNGTKSLNEGSISYFEPRSRDVWIALAFAYQMLTGRDVTKRITIMPAELQKSVVWPSLDANWQRVLTVILCSPPGSQAYVAEMLPDVLRDEVLGLRAPDLIDWVTAALQPDHVIPPIDVRVVQAKQALADFQTREAKALFAQLPDAASFSLQTFTLSEWRLYGLLKTVQSMPTRRADQWEPLIRIGQVLDSRQSPESEAPDLSVDNQTLAELEALLTASPDSTSKMLPVALRTIAEEMRQEVILRRDWPFFGQPLLSLRNLSNADLAKITQVRDSLTKPWINERYRDRLIYYLIDGKQSAPHGGKSDDLLVKSVGDLQTHEATYRQFTALTQALAVELSEQDFKQWEALAKALPNDHLHLDLLNTFLEKQCTPTADFLRVFGWIKGIENRLVPLWGRALKRSSTYGRLTEALWRYPCQRVQALFKTKDDAALSAWAQLVSERPDMAEHGDILQTALSSLLNTGSNTIEPAPFEKLEQLKAIAAKTTAADRSQQQSERLQPLSALNKALRPTAGNDELHAALGHLEQSDIAQTALAQLYIERAHAVLQHRTNQVRLRIGLGVAAAVIGLVVLIVGFATIKISAQNDSSTATEVAYLVSQDSASTTTAQAISSNSTASAQAISQNATVTAHAATDNAATKTQAIDNTANANTQMIIGNATNGQATVLSQQAAASQAVLTTQSAQMAAAQTMTAQAVASQTSLAQTAQFKTQAAQDTHQTQTQQSIDQASTRTEAALSLTDTVVARSLIDLNATSTRQAGQTLIALMPTVPPTSNPSATPNTSSLPLLLAPGDVASPNYIGRLIASTLNYNTPVVVGNPTNQTKGLPAFFYAAAGDQFQLFCSSTGSLAAGVTTYTPCAPGPTLKLLGCTLTNAVALCSSDVTCTKVSDKITVALCSQTYAMNSSNSAAKALTVVVCSDVHMLHSDSNSFADNDVCSQLSVFKPSLPQRYRFFAAPGDVIQLPLGADTSLSASHQVASSGDSQWTVQENQFGYLTFWVQFASDAPLIITIKPTNTLSNESFNNSYLFYAQVKGSISGEEKPTSPISCALVTPSSASVTPSSVPKCQGIGSISTLTAACLVRDPITLSLIWGVKQCSAKPPTPTKSPTAIPTPTNTVTQTNTPISEMLH